MHFTEIKQRLTDAIDDLDKFRTDTLNEVRSVIAQGAVTRGKNSPDSAVAGTKTLAQLSEVEHLNTELVLAMRELIEALDAAATTEELGALGNLLEGIGSLRSNIFRHFTMLQWVAIHARLEHARGTDAWINNWRRHWDDNYRVVLETIDDELETVVKDADLESEREPDELLRHAIPSLRWGLDLSPEQISEITNIGTSVVVAALAKKTADLKLQVFQSDMLREAERLGLTASSLSQGDTDLVLVITKENFQMNLHCSIINNRGRPKQIERRPHRGIGGIDIEAELTWESNTVKYTAFVKGFSYAHPVTAETLEDIVSIVQKELDSYVTPDQTAKQQDDNDDDRPGNIWALLLD